MTMPSPNKCSGDIVNKDKKNTRRKSESDTEAYDEGWNSTPNCPTIHLAHTEFETVQARQTHVRYREAAKSMKVNGSPISDWLRGNACAMHNERRTNEQSKHDERRTTDRSKNNERRKNNRSKSYARHLTMIEISVARLERMIRESENCSKESLCLVIRE